MTIIIGFVNENFAILGIDGLVKQSRTYDDGFVEVEDIYREKLGSLNDMFIAHQGRITTKSTTDYSTQDVCDQINIEDSLNFSDKCKSIIEQFKTYIDSERNTIVIIALDNGEPRIYYYDSTDSRCGFVNGILMTNPADFEHLQKQGKLSPLGSNYESFDHEAVYSWINNSLLVLIENFEKYGGVPKIVSVERHKN